MDQRTAAHFGIVGGQGRRERTAEFRLRLDFYVKGPSDEPLHRDEAVVFRTEGVDGRDKIESDFPVFSVKQDLLVPHARVDRHDEVPVQHGKLHISVLLCQRCILRNRCGVTFS